MSTDSVARHPPHHKSLPRVLFSRPRAVSEINLAAADTIRTIPDALNPLSNDSLPGSTASKIAACHQKYCSSTTAYEELFTGSEFSSYSNMINSNRDPTIPYAYVPLQWTLLQ
ncbi:hypothetical protein HDU83_001750, partial [Entophlyctis luteolus]